MTDAPVKPIVNVADVPLRENGHGDKFAAKLGRIGSLTGMSGLGCTLHVLPSGKAAFPFHRHHVIHEMFYVVSGSGEYRLGDKTYPLRAGDVAAAPAGTDAHQIKNTGGDELRYLAFSSKSPVDVVDYPDSGKVAVAAGIKDGSDYRSASYAAVGRMTATDYWDGE